MFLERDNRIAVTKEEIVDLVMGEARKKFGDSVPEDATVGLKVDIDNDTGEELFKLTWT